MLAGTFEADEKNAEILPALTFEAERHACVGPLPVRRQAVRELEDIRRRNFLQLRLCRPGDVIWRGDAFGGDPSQSRHDLALRPAVAGIVRVQARRRFPEI